MGIKVNNNWVPVAVNNKYAQTLGSGTSSTVYGEITNPISALTLSITHEYWSNDIKFTVIYDCPGSTSLNGSSNVRIRGHIQCNSYWNASQFDFDFNADVASLAQSSVMTWDTGHNDDWWLEIRLSATIEWLDDGGNVQTAYINTANNGHLYISYYLQHSQSGTNYYNATNIGVPVIKWANINNIGGTNGSWWWAAYVASITHTHYQTGLGDDWWMHTITLDDMSAQDRRCMMFEVEIDGHLHYITANTNNPIVVPSKYNGIVRLRPMGYIGCRTTAQSDRETMAQNIWCRYSGGTD